MSALNPSTLTLHQHKFDNDRENIISNDDANDNNQDEVVVNTLTNNWAVVQPTRQGNNNSLSDKSNLVSN